MQPKQNHSLQIGGIRVIPAAVERKFLRDPGQRLSPGVMFEMKSDHPAMSTPAAETIRAHPKRPIKMNIPIKLHVVVRDVLFAKPELQTFPSTGVRVRPPRTPGMTGQ